jgi:hypothetical protein
VPSSRPRDLLSDAVLGRLRGTDGADAATVAGDIAGLRDAGYLTVALPPELGGLGCTLRQAACGQRRLAGRAPLTALAVSAHLYWTGAAADARRSGDSSVQWILLEAARGALFGAGHGTPGGDLKFASPESRCDRDTADGYRFLSADVRSSVTPGWDWLAVHGVYAPGRPQAVLAFAGSGTRCTPAAYRVARVLPAGAPSDVFTSSAIGWGCGLLASVEFAAARREFRLAVSRVSGAVGDSIAGSVMAGAVAVTSAPDQWATAEACLRLDSMKARIAEITHPWPLVREPLPDLSGQHLISLFAMRHEVTEGSRRVRELSLRIASSRGSADPAIPAR